MKFLIVPLSLFAILLFGYSCSTDEFSDDINPEDTTEIDTNQVEEEPTATEILVGNWIVDEAYVHPNTHDNSSAGLTFEIYSSGSYKLSTGYNGTWRFNEDESHIVWDEGTQYEQDFELIDFSEDKIEAKFKSAFTGQSSRWIMIPME